MAGTNFKDALESLTSAVVIDADSAINTGELQNDEEIKQLMDLAYEMADELSPTGQRTPFDIEMIETKRKQLEEELRQRTEEEEEDQKHRHAWQDWAEREREKTELSLKREQMNRLQEALKKPEVKDLLKKPEVQDLLFKIMNHEIKPQQAFEAIKTNPRLNEQMLSLTSQRKTKKAGKSRVFRRKNKKMTSTSRRKVRGTRRHRKSYSRRSTRK
jgi:hypothetical protein